MGISPGAAYEALSAMQKPARGVSLYSRYINRPLGRRFAALSAWLGLTPNGVTVVSAIMTAGAALLIAIPRPSLISGLGVAALLVLGFALDAADGQLARLLHRASPAGEWFDHVVDAGKAVCLHGAVLIAAYRYFTPDLWWLLVPLAYQALSVVVQAGGTLRELLGRIARGGTAKPPADRRRWAPIILLVADSGVFGLIFLTWGWPLIFMVVYSAFFVANLCVGAALLMKWMRELSDLARTSAT